MENDKRTAAKPAKDKNTIRHVMVDIETLGTQAGCPILAIGACDIFETGETGARFYQRVELKSALEYGSIDADTLRWWMKQSDQARADAFESRNGDIDRDLVLLRFAEFLGATAKNNWCNPDVCLWGNGSDFDNAILAAAFKETGYKAVPWKFWNNRCYRTLKSLYPHVQMVRHGTHHNALDDALSQAEHVRQICELGGAGIKVI